MGLHKGTLQKVHKTREISFAFLSHCNRRSTLRNPSRNRNLIISSYILWHQPKSTSHVSLLPSRRWTLFSAHIPFAAFTLLSIPAMTAAFGSQLKIPGFPEEIEYHEL